MGSASATTRMVRFDSSSMLLLASRRGDAGVPGDDARDATMWLEGHTESNVSHVGVAPAALIQPGKRSGLHADSVIDDVADLKPPAT